jgi:FkbM family methyltransferase
MSLLARIQKKFLYWMRFTFTGKKFWLVFVFNSRQLVLKKSKTRLRYNSKNPLYTASQLGFVDRKFNSPKQATFCYWNGFEARGEILKRGYFLDQIEFFDGDLVIDCGAHLGDLKLFFICAGINVEYIAFEPSSVEFSCLVENVKPSKAYNLGLWNEIGQRKFFISTLGADSSFIEPPTHESTEIMSISRLDVLETRKIKLLKLEAEGGEIEVILGCMGILPNICYISADLGFERGVHQENTIAQVTNMLLENGFNMVKAIAPSGRMTFLFKNSLCTEGSS